MLRHRGLFCFRENSMEKKEKKGFNIPEWWEEEWQGMPELFRKIRLLTLL